MRWESFPLWALLLAGSRCSGGYRSQFTCRDTDLVLYSLVFETHWTRQLFPKQYPENRPPAHWSKMIGMTHDENYVLFRIGEMADKEFKTFAETGKTEVLGGQKRVDHVLDEFSSSSIKTGAGRTQVNFFVDGNHSLVSVAVKIIPSPDWFVGVDSLALCVEGNWLDSITIEASPIDAGTDSGFTFTAPNWETEPQERISKITSTWPKHPANSFYYPKLRDLPVIATFHMAKKKLYQLKRKVDVEERRTENATETPPPKSVFFLDNSLSANRSKYKKYKRQKLKKHAMDFNKERETNIIKNIAKEIVFECTQSGLEVTQELANYMVKLTLLNPKHGFTASEVMPRSKTQQLVQLVVDELKQDTPAMNCIRMQVYWDSVKLNVVEMKKEYWSNMADKAEPYLNEILVLDREELGKMSKLAASYILVLQNLGNPNVLQQLKETMSAIHSIFKNKDAIIFFKLNDEGKTEMIKNIAKRVTGIRIYLKMIGKSFDNIEDVRKISFLIEETKERLHKTGKTITSRIEAIRRTISSIMSIDYFLLDAFQTANVYLPSECDANDLTYAKKILAIMLQHNIYISDIQSVLEEIDGNVHFYINEHDEILAKLRMTIKNREAVPTAEVYSDFERLGGLWSELQSYYYCLEAVEEVINDFDEINKAEYFLPTQLEKVISLEKSATATTGGTTTTTTTAAVVRKKSSESDKGSLTSSALALDEDEDYILEFNGFCAWTLYYTNGLLVPGSPQIQTFKFNGLHYSFSSKNAFELWSKEPQYYVNMIYEYVRNNTELVELLSVYDSLYECKHLQLIKTVERKTVTITEETQTLVHPIEKHWDKDYTFSVWELKKRALALSRLVKCVTKSVQTASPHSHFRASIGLLAAPDKDKEVQTKRDSSCVHPAIATYLYGLRGQQEDNFRVVDLTQPIDEAFEKIIVLEGRPPCKERRRPKPFQPLQPFFTDPCRSSSSDNKCDYYYSYDSNDSSPSMDSTESGNKPYYFQYNAEG